MQWKIINLRLHFNKLFLRFTCTHQVLTKYRKYQVRFTQIWIPYLAIGERRRNVKGEERKESRKINNHPVRGGNRHHNSRNYPRWTDKTPPERANLHEELHALCSPSLLGGATRAETTPWFIIHVVNLLRKIARVVCLIPREGFPTAFKKKNQSVILPSTTHEFQFSCSWKRSPYSTLEWDIFD